MVETTVCWHLRWAVESFQGFLGGAISGFRNHPNGERGIHRIAPLVRIRLALARSCCMRCHARGVADFRLPLLGEVKPGQRKGLSSLLGYDCFSFFLLSIFLFFFFGGGGTCFVVFQETNRNISCFFGKDGPLEKRHWVSLAFCSLFVWGGDLRGVF